MKQILKEIIAFLLVQLHRLKKKKNDSILSVYFHNPTKKVFEDVVKWILSNGYKIITLDELAIIISKKLRTNKLAIITFDDGWITNLDLISIIEKYTAPVTIFVPTEPVISGNYWFEFARLKDQEQYTKIENIEIYKKLPSAIQTEKVAILKSKFELKRSCISIKDLQTLSSHKLITIGSHTLTHPILHMCTPSQQNRELLESKITLGNWLNRNVNYFAYPNGDYNQISINILHSCGYKLAFTNVPGMIDLTKVNRYIIPRNGISDNGGHYESIAKAIGIWQEVFPKKIHQQKALMNLTMSDPSASTVG
jgi:peptidoglycan/xylan/chitin deacetylase (PgdA/CDA1 family)